MLLAGINFMLSGQNEDPEIMSFSLSEAIEFSWENNTDIRNSNLDIESAKKEVWKTTAIGLPQATANFDYQHLPGELPSLFFPSGDGSVEEIRLGVKNSSTYSVTLSQLVFSGEYIVGLQAAKTYLKLSENSLEKSRNDVKSNTSSAYYTILLLENNRKILDSSLVNNRSILAETKAMAETGFLESTDYDQFSIVINTLENGIKAIDRQINLAYRLFKINLGLDETAEITLTQSIDDLLNEVEYANLLSKEFILDNNIDYRILKTNEKISELSLKREKSSFLPTLSAFYLYQDKTNKADFDITFNHILGLSVALPIFSSGQRVASVSQARINLNKSTNTREQVGETLLMAVQQVRGDFQTAFESYSTESLNVELSEKIYQKTLVKFREGVASSLDVTQAHNQYLDAVNAYTTAVLEVLNAKTALEIILSNQ